MGLYKILKGHVLISILLSLLLQSCAKSKKTLSNAKSKKTFQNTCTTELGKKTPIVAYCDANCFSEVEKQTIKHTIQEQEAWFSDIAIPMGMQPCGYWLTKHQQQAFYFLGKISSSYEELASWYYQEMERLGWRQNASMVDEEIFLLFDKPQKFCNVSVRPIVAKLGKEHVDAVVLTLYFGAKKADF